RNHRDAVVAQLADKASGGDPGDAVTDDGDMFRHGPEKLSMQQLRVCMIRLYACKQKGFSYHVKPRVPATSRRTFALLFQKPPSSLPFPRPLLRDSSHFVASPMRFGIAGNADKPLLWTPVAELIQWMHVRDIDYCLHPHIAEGLRARQTLDAALLDEHC